MSKKSKTENLKILQEFDYESSDSDEVDDTIGEIVSILYINL